MKEKAGAAMASVLIVALSACGSTEITKSADQTSATVEETESATEQASSSPSPAEAKVGSTITLEGFEYTLKIAVTVVKVVSGARPKDEFNTPSSNERLVAVQITLKNVGTDAYDDSPSNGAKLIDTEGQQYDTSYNEVALGPSLDSAKIAPGGLRKGYLVFELPRKAKAERFQFALESGMATNTGEWLLS